LDNASKVEKIIAPTDSGLNFFNPDPFEKLAKAAPMSLPKIIMSIKGVVEQANQQLLNAQQAYHENRLNDTARILHTMRGSVGTLGAKSFAALTLQIEAKIHENAIDEVEDLLRMAALELQKTISMAQVWLKNHEDNLGGEVSTDAKPVLQQAKLLELKDLLSANNMAACDLFQELHASLQTQCSPAMMTQLDAAIQGLDFEVAINLLDKLA
jgi:chemotaxis protein histidine kinase CheA